MKEIKERTFLKNYKALCSLLEITYKTNTESRKRQIEGLKQYYIIIRKGNGFFAQSRKEIKPAELKETTRTGKYNKKMNKLLMHYILENNVAQSKHILLIDLFRHLKYVACTTPGIYNLTKSIREQYGNWIFSQSRSNINAKIYDLLSNSLVSLSRSGHIIIDYYYELKGNKFVEGSDEIIKKTTGEMLSKRKIKNEFFLKRKSENYQKQFYAERNIVLKRLYKFEVKERVAAITITNQGEYKHLNTVQYKKCCMDLFEQIKKDLIGKLERERQNLIKAHCDVSALPLIEMFGEDIFKTDQKRLKELELLEKLYNEYLVYKAD